MQYENVLEKAYALAHLPADKMQEGVTHVTSLVDVLAEEVPQEMFTALQGFATYLRTFWLPLSDVLSVYKRPIKTNNICETFHLHAGRFIGKREPLYKMLGNCNNFNDHFVCVYELILMIHFLL